MSRTWEQIEKQHEKLERHARKLFAEQVADCCDSMGLDFSNGFDMYVTQNLGKEITDEQHEYYGDHGLVRYCMGEWLLEVDTPDAIVDAVDNYQNMFRNIPQCTYDHKTKVWIGIE